MNTTNNLIQVIDATGKTLSPCKPKVAWVLLQRKRAIQVNDSTIQIIVSKAQIKANKKAAIQRDQRICHYCGKYIPETEIATADHVIPKTISTHTPVGYDDIDNLVCACVACNNHKDRTPYEQYLSHRFIVLVAFFSFTFKLTPIQTITSLIAD